MQWYFCFFLLSGFCSILYEIIWLRIAMAQFGVTTAMVSLVLSAFMIGLGLGSWGSGLVVRKYGAGARFPALRLYALMELLIGLSAIAVPYELVWGRELLLKTVREMSFSSSAYYLPSGIWLAITLVPWCMCMGATFPLAMEAIRQDRDPKSARSFSYLYLANVLGAAAGAMVPLFLIELFGFQHTLHISAILNLLLAASAFSLSLVKKPLPAGENLNETRKLPKPVKSGISFRRGFALAAVWYGTDQHGRGGRLGAPFYSRFEHSGLRVCRHSWTLSDCNGSRFVALPAFESGRHAGKRSALDCARVFRAGGFFERRPESCGCRRFFGW